MGVISWSSDKTDSYHKMVSTTMYITIIMSLAMITMVESAHTDYFAKPHYSFEYGVEAYGLGHGYGHGKGGHGDPGPLPYKHTESRDGYNTQGHFDVKLPGQSYHSRDYLVILSWAVVHRLLMNH